jgi:ketosteroid isomerase-like protein
MTSGGTDVIEMPASTVGSTTGTFEAVGRVPSAVVGAAVVGASEVGAAVVAAGAVVARAGEEAGGAAVLDEHAVVRSRAATSHGAPPSARCGWPIPFERDNPVTGADTSPGHEEGQMGAKENLDLVDALLRASRDGDHVRYAELLAEDAVLRAAGVPAAMGGVISGRESMAESVRTNAAGNRFEVKEMFADDEHVCVVGKLTADRWPGTEVLKGADRPYSTYQCIVYRIADGKVAEATAYANWLDPYVQLGLIDVSTLTR